MSLFHIEGIDLHLPRNIALVDTNVLVAFHDDADQHHEAARLFFEIIDDYSLVIAPPVIVETCGMLSRRRWKGFELTFLSWLQTPGKVDLLAPLHSPQDMQAALSRHSTWMAKYKLDYVDAYLMEVAHRITETCDLRPYARIVTFDTGDYLKCYRGGYRFSLFDMKNHEPFDLELD